AERLDARLAALVLGDLEQRGRRLGRAGVDQELHGAGLLVARTAGGQLDGELERLGVACLEQRGQRGLPLAPAAVPGDVDERLIPWVAAQRRERADRRGGVAVIGERGLDQRLAGVGAAEVGERLRRRRRDVAVAALDQLGQRLDRGRAAELAERGDRRGARGH